MRSLALPFALWFSALQSISPSTETTARLVGIAGVLGTLTAMIYRLGVWRQQMEHTKEAVGAEIKAHREESAVFFDRIERRLEAIDHMLGAASDHQQRVSRWRTRIERRVERLEQNDDNEQANGGDYAGDTDRS
jgi:uncharacterized protein YicC (UPF0701 family)